MKLGFNYGRLEATRAYKMPKKEKRVKELIYEGLGFPVPLKDVTLRHIDGEWHPKIDVEKVAREALEKLPLKSSPLTGDEIHFIRTYLGKNKSSFAEIFNLSHTAISKWENAKSSPAPISSSQEILLRLYIEDYLEVGASAFYKAYKKIFRDRVIKSS